MKPRTAPANKTSRDLGSAGRVAAGACLHSALILSAFAAMGVLTGCNEDKQQADGSLSSMSAGRELSVIGSIRPKADPSVIARIRQEEEAAQQRALAAANAANNNNNNQQPGLQGGNTDPANRDLPSVNTSPIAGIAQAFGFGNNNNNASTGTSSPANNTAMSMPAQVPTPPPVASYGGYQSGPVGGLIPPPPAVSLTTTAQPYLPPAGDPYAAAYANPYAPNPYQYAAPPQPAHPAGSMFSNGGSGGGNSSASDESAKKRASMVVITPTGMDPRSPYKQRDDLKILLKGALANAPMRELHEEKVVQMLNKTDVGLPAESTKGMISLTQRQIDNLFRNQQVDKKVVPLVKKVESDLAQAYYRYLYSFNRFALTQQQVAARKQEVDMADSASEKQRAAADLSSSQNEADAAKDDLRAAQQDLASVSGAQSARSVIAKVSGVAPSLDSLAVADNSGEASPQKKDEGMLGSVASALNVFNVFGHKEKAKSGDGGDQVAAAADTKSAARDNHKDKKKGKKGDGQPAAMAQVASASAPRDPVPVPVDRPSPAATASAIAFELKNVQTTPRKSILKVCVRNNSGDSVVLDADGVAVSEGDKRLPDAAVRAEWDSSAVAPSQEVTGTITIFGRPWNDKLTVSLSEGGKTVQLRR